SVPPAFTRHSRHFLTVNLITNTLRDHISTRNRLLAYPPDATLPPVAVPYLPGYQFDGGEFHTFFDRMGLSARDIPTRQHAGLLQEWLFFGLIDKLVDEPVNRSSYVRRGIVNGEACDVIDASPVRELIDRLTVDCRAATVLQCSIDFGGVEELPALSRLLHKRLVQSGWCANQVLRLGCHDSQMVMYYLPSLPRGERKTISHTNWTFSNCSAYNTSEAEYITRHVNESCKCDFLRVDEDRVVEILAMGKIPLISMRRDATHGIAVDVWADGLGNTTGNALPGCQLDRLHRSLMMHQQPSSKGFMSFGRGRSDEVVFWMDTLCIPVKPRHKDLRIRAINQMALVYSGAENTLVLDEELQQHKRETQPLESLWARCLASKWNSLCSRPLGIVIVFSRPLPQTILIYQLQEACYEQAHTNTDWLSMRNNAKKKVDDNSRTRHFISMWRTIAKRSSTKMDDIHVILANLTDFKASQIQEIPDLQDRTKVMLQSIGRFPVSIMYSRAIRPLAGKDHPDRWTPAIPGPELLDPGDFGYQAKAIGGNGSLLVISHNENIGPFSNTICLTESKGMITQEMFVTLPLKHGGSPMVQSFG
ncbi:het domain protein, partial [Colletotrichum musicola]